MAESARWAVFLGQSVDDSDFALANVAVRVRAPAADETSGLARLIFMVEDVAGAARQLERRGLALSLCDGEAFVSAHGVSLGLSLAGTSSWDAAAPGGIAALDHVVIRTSDPERAIATYGARLGLDFRLDRSNPAWGARLLFFRCGDAVVEVSAALDAPRSDAPDRLSGLAFRARDPDEARSRLAAAGFDVSEVRSGRKPGTRVFTVRSGLAGAPCLVLSSAS
ncbi:MAG TPA: VOC family protein [Caulobacteraceae bacterium]|jgi:catechol 2,3-dioxygenase-like lactoylglutathione lyase family enzyme|nr:VOC family protein [Caulobacteraceae bacterium]